LTLSKLTVGTTLRIEFKLAGYQTKEEKVKVAPGKHTLSVNWRSFLVVSVIGIAAWSSQSIASWF